jgi:hypothetical protein
LSEVKTQPVTSVHLGSWRELADKRIPGSVSFSPYPDSDGEQYMSYVCPCGCGHQSSLTVGNGFKPADPPSWQWNGSRDKPTLSPSVHHVGHWHGYLTDGVWRSC